MGIITTENICRSFKSGNETVHALKNINIEIKSGKLTILMGRSGSGKTTLINLLGALDRPNSGKVFFDGVDIIKLSDAKRDEIRRKKIGLIFQSVALVSMLSAYENIEFGLRVAGMKNKTGKRRARTLECLNLVGLSKRMKHRPHELSGGEQQRIAIARAIAHKPHVVFADEPTAELDTHTGLKVVKLFKDLVEQEDVTVLMTTHDPGMLEIADHVYMLEDGEIIDEQ